MKRNLKRKFWIALVISIAISILVITSDVQAESEEQANSNLNESLETEEKIMMYDSKTNETTEVDIQELKQVLRQKNNTKGGSSNYLDSYDPYVNSLEERINLFSATSTERITNT